jgi:hypothetical protein
MAEHVHKSYSCDRCKADLGAERPKRDQPPLIRASFNYDSGPGPTYDWSDLCDSCNDAVRAFFLPIGELRPPQSEKGDARAGIRALFEWGNKDAADYILVRCWRILGRKVTAKLAGEA